MTARDLIAAAEAGDRSRVADVLAGLNERDRKELASAVDRKLPTTWKHDRHQRLAATLAFTGLATVGAVKREGVWQPALSDHELADESLSRVVAERAPSFRRKLPAAWLSQPFGGPWLAIRRLVRDGLCPPVEDEGRWAMAVASGIRGPLRRDAFDRHAELERVVRDDLGLVDDLGLLFRYEEAARSLSGAYADDPPDACDWSWVLCRLTADGLLDRATLLDEALAGLERDLPASAVGFAQDVHRRLGPTDEELRSRADRYTRLVSSPVPTTQRLALAACLRLAASGTLDGPRFVEAATVPLGGRQKNVAVAALRVLETRGAVAPDVAIDGGIAALEHPREDVQQRGLALVASHADELRDRHRADLLAAAEVVAPTLRDRVEALTGVTLPTPSRGIDAEVDPGEVRAAVEARPPRERDALDLIASLEVAESGEWPAAPDVTDPIAVLGPDEVEPVADADELVALVAALLEGEGSAIDAERALAAIAVWSPMAANPGWVATLSPIRKRATAVLEEGVGDFTVPGNSSRADWAQLVHCWLEGRLPPTLAHDREVPPIPAPGGGGLRGRLRDRLRRPPPPVGLAVNRLQREPGRHTVDSWAKSDRAIPAVAGFTGLRLWEVARHAARQQPLLLLATPTHRSGWVTPETLVERVAGTVATGLELPRFDLVQALHRVPPGDHATAREAAADIPGLAGAALRARLGGTDEVADPGLAAASRPAPMGPLRLTTGLVHKGYREEPVEALVVAPEGENPGPVPIDDPLGLARYRLRHPGALVDAWWGGTAPLFHGADPQSSGWHAVALPAAPEVLPAVAALIVATMADQDQPRFHPEPLVHHLINGHPAAGAQTAELAAALLLSKSAVLRTLATDLLVALTDQGRIDPPATGAALARLTTLEVGSLGRVADALQDLSAVSPTHAGVVHALLTAFVAGAVDTPRAINVPLEVLRDVAVANRCPVDDAVARDRLDAWSSGSSKRATAARACLAVEGSSSLLAVARLMVVANRATWSPL